MRGEHLAKGCVAESAHPRALSAEDYRGGAGRGAGRNEEGGRGRREEGREEHRRRKGGGKGGRQGFLGPGVQPAE